ncbi:hypothetical protein AMEX_G15889, partial [Astyanax mexicanus]
MVALHCGTLEGTDHFKASCNDDVILPCRVRDQTEKYRYVIWYRDNSAIIKRKNNDLTLFNNSTASLGVKESLVLWRVKPYDSGKYQCFLAADIGAKDAESQVTLTVSGITFSNNIRNEMLLTSCSILPIVLSLYRCYIYICVCVCVCVVVICVWLFCYNHFLTRLLCLGMQESERKTRKWQYEPTTQPQIYTANEPQTKQTQIIIYIPYIYISISYMYILYQYSIYT